MRKRRGGESRRIQGELCEGPLVTLKPGTNRTMGRCSLRIQSNGTIREALIFLETNRPPPTSSFSSTVSPAKSLSNRKGEGGGEVETPANSGVIGTWFHPVSALSLERL